MKLFKKALAAVLAGVMALSMVACGTTPGTNPGTDIPDPNPTLSEADQFFQMLNSGVEIQVNAAKWAGVTLTVPKFENKLQDKAAAILDAIAAGEVTEAGKVTGYKLTEKNITDKKLMDDIDGVYVLSAAGVPTNLPQIGKDTYALKEGTLTIKKDSDDAKKLKFDADAAKAYIVGGLYYGLSTGEWFNDSWLEVENTTTVNTKTTAIEYTHVYEIGVASKVINGQTCTIFVYADAE